MIGINFILYIKKKKCILHFQQGTIKYNQIIKTLISPKKKLKMLNKYTTIINTQAVIKNKIYVQNQKKKK